MLWAIPRKRKNMADAKILVVDDNDMVRSVAQQMLVALGYEAAVVDSGERALEEFSESRFDLILLDLDMPDMSGTQVYNALRVQAPDLKIVFMTGHSVREVQGMDYAAYLSKPFTLAAIRETIEGALAA